MTDNVSMKLFHKKLCDLDDNEKSFLKKWNKDARYYLGKNLDKCPNEEIYFIMRLDSPIFAM